MIPAITVCTVPWCEHVGTDRCTSGVDGEGMLHYAHETTLASFDFTNRAGRRTVSGWVSTAATCEDGQDVGVGISLESWPDGYMVTPAEARRLAAALLNAADEADEIGAASR
jgi:hypothetical protein